MTRRRTSRRDFEAFIADELAKIDAQCYYSDAAFQQQIVFGAAMLANHQGLIDIVRWKELIDEAGRRVRLVIDRGHGRKAA